MPSLMVVLGLNGNSFAAGLNQAVSKSKVSGKQIQDNLNKTFLAPGINSTIKNATAPKNYGNDFKRLLEQQEKEELQSAVRAATRSNSARRILRQRADAREQQEKITAQQQLDARIEQISRDNLARRLRRERAQKRAADAAEAQRNTIGGKIGSFVTGAFTGIGAQLAAIAAPITAFFAAKQFVTDAVNVNLAYERILNTLKAGTGSITLAKEEFEFLRFVANKTGSTVTELGDDYARAMMAAQGLGLSVADTRKIFESFATLGATIGLPAERQKMVMLALTQMMSKGKISMDELKRQMGDHLPMAMSLFAKGMGVSVERMIQMVEAGEVSSTVLTKVADVIANSPDLQRVNQTTVAIGQMKNEWEEIKAAFGEAINPEVLDSFRKITVALRLMKELRGGALTPKQIIGGVGGMASDAMFGDGVSAAQVYYAAHKEQIDKFLKWLDSKGASKKVREIFEGKKDRPGTSESPLPLPDFTANPNSEAERTRIADANKEEADLKKQIADEEFRAMDATAKRLKLQQDLLRAELLLQESAPGLDEDRARLELLKAKSALTQHDEAESKKTDKSRGRGIDHSVNELQRVGAYSAQSINTSILQENQKHTAMLEKIVRNTEPRRTTRGTTF